jgi:Na+/proline symporter
MSTLSGSLNSLASSTMIDIYKPKWGKNNSESKDLLISRLITFFWGLIFIAGALLFKDKENPVVELGLAIASFTYGGLLGTFFLGNWKNKVSENDALVSMWSAIYFMTWIIGQKGWILYIIVFLNALAAIWILYMAKGKKHRLFVFFWLVLITTLIFSTPAFKFAWPWYVFLGSTITFTIGNLLALIKEGTSQDHSA